MILLDVADMLADVLGIDDVYAGTIDGNQAKCIGVYNAKSADKHSICIGGKECTKTLDKKISILIHWTDNPTAAEKKADEILETVSDIREYRTDDFTVRFLKCNQAVPVGKDDRGVYEYVIEATIYYERNE